MKTAGTGSPTFRSARRTFFYSAPGRDLAPAIKDLIVVQNGLGAQLDARWHVPRCFAFGSAGLRSCRRRGSI